MRTLRLLCLFFSAVCMSALHAVSVAPPSFEDLVRRSDLVVRTEVLGTRCVEKGEGATRRIVTLIALRVEKILVGNAVPDLELEMLGGTVGDESLEVSGMTTFNKGDRDILFIAGNGRALCPLVAMNHGRYLRVRAAGDGVERVARADATPLRDVGQIQSVLGLPAPASSLADKLLPMAMQLEEFESLILRCAAARAQAK